MQASGYKTLITAAGGNGTAIEVLDQPLTREEYETRGRILGNEMESFGAEQAGFLVLGHRHFEMAGGEFCGNATRSAAVLFAQANKSSTPSFTVSGFDATVEALVTKLGDSTYEVRCTFPGMPTVVRNVVLHDGTPASIVDLGGIVHVVIEAAFPSGANDYEKAHRLITEQFQLTERGAVGVVWFEREPNAVKIHPVVWVKAVDTFFYETSCGSGTIAVGKVTGIRSIMQPTGKPIITEFTESTVVLQSEMEVVR